MGHNGALLNKYCLIFWQSSRFPSLSQPPSPALQKPYLNSRNPKSFSLLMISTMAVGTIDSHEGS
jgi:hypothetical protein